MLETTAEDVETAPGVSWRAVVFCLLLFVLAFAFDLVVSAIPMWERAFDRSSSVLVGLLIFWPLVLWVSGRVKPPRGGGHG